MRGVDGKNAAKSAELRTWATSGRHALEVVDLDATSDASVARAPALGDPQEVVDALVALVELPRGKKPLRRTVGKDVEQGVGAINETCTQVQHHLLTAFKLR